ncbi:hypothetical protein HDV00_010710 [Rhizophlyctis rosea]|nr:hypothetical protein HDV00_010710 [Rhizophlyctis rosea]
MKFVSRIKGNRDIHVLTQEEFRAQADKAKVALKQGKPDPKYTLQEWFQEDALVRPFYDWDAKYKEKPEDLEAKKKEEGNKFAATVGELHPGCKVIYAQRHGQLDEGGYKISLRAFVCDAVMVVTDIPLHVRRVIKMGPKQVHERLDLSVYKGKEQLLGVLYGTKDINHIKRYLVPLPEHESEDPCEFLAQNVHADAKRVTVAAGAATKGQKQKKNKVGGKKHKKIEKSGVQGASTTGDGDHEGRRTLTRADVSEALDAASDFFGEKYRMQETLQTVIVDPSTGSLTFPTEKKWCCIRRGTHQSNNPYITVTERGARFKCLDEECAAKEQQPHIPLAQLPMSVRELFQVQIVATDKDHEAVGEAREICKRTIVELYADEKVEDLSPCKAVDEEGKPLAKFITDLRQLRCHYCKELMVTAEHSLQGMYHPKLFVVLNNWNLQQNVSVVVHNNYGALSEDPITDYEQDGVRVFEDDDLNACFVRALQGTDASLSELVFALFKDSFHCAKNGSKGTEGLWYQYLEHHWAGRAELDLRACLASKELFLKYFRRALQHYEQNQIQTEETKKKTRAIRRLIEQIGDGGRRKRIVDDAILRFHKHRPDFTERLDTAEMLVFTNGVMDLTDFTFREGRPEDLLSIPLPIPLPIPYQPQDVQSAECAFIMEFMTSIQPDQETRDYLLTVLSLCLSTDTSMQYFWIFTGGGANGKSKLMNFLREALGDHYGTASAALLTRRREDANQANKSLNSLRKARVAVFSEGASSEVLQVNTMKLFSGEDVISARGIHEKQQRWTPMFKCIIVCNDIPELDDNSWPAWRRIKVIDFPTSFVHDPVRPHERLKDPAVGGKLSKCTGALICILLDYLCRFKKSGRLVEAQAVKAATEKYKSDNDVVYDFIQQKLKPQKGGSIQWMDLFNAYKSWPMARQMKSGPLKTELNRRGVQYQNTRVDGEPFCGVKNWILLPNEAGQTVNNLEKSEEK